MSRPESSTKPADDARRALDDARVQLLVAGVAERDTRARYATARDAWLALPEGSAFTPEYKAFSLASSACCIAHEALATARTNVAACEVDLATALRFAGEES